MSKSEKLFEWSCASGTLTLALELRGPLTAEDYGDFIDMIGIAVKQIKRRQVRQWAASLASDFYPMRKAA